MNKTKNSALKEFAEANGITIVEAAKYIMENKDHYPMMKMADGGDVDDTTPNKITSKKPPTKSGAELNSLKQEPMTQLGTKKVPTKKTNTKPSKKGSLVFTPRTAEQIQQEPIVKVPGGTDANAIDVINPPTLKTSNADNLNSTQAEILNQSAQKGMAEYEAEKNNNQSFWDKINGTALLDYGIGAAQVGIGLKELRGSKRPVFDGIEKSQTATGFTPEQKFLLDQQNQNLLRQEIFGAQNAAGGSASNAYNMTRSAVNNAFTRDLEKQIADNDLKKQNQAYNDNKALQKTQLNRMIFDDSMQAFRDKQNAGATLTQAGFNNVLSANRFQNFMKLREQENQFNNRYLNTGM